MTTQRPTGRVCGSLVLLAALVCTSPGPVTALGPGVVPDERGLPTAIDAMRELATDTGRPGRARGRATTRPRHGLPITYGRDGRLTVLLIGSDWRRRSGGERFDVILVATIDPRTGEAAMVSIPRDMGGIPFAGGGASGGMRVNSIYFIRYRDPSLPHGRIDRRGVKRFSRDIGRLLGTEIDYWAMTRFVPFTRLIERIGGVRLDVPEAVHDPSYRNQHVRGIWFPKAKGYRLRGNPKCAPKPKRCHSALDYVRSRKGTVGDRANNDYRRAERQQDVVRAAVRKVLDGGSGLHLLGTLLLVRGLVDTDIPKTAVAAAQLYDLASRMRLPASNRKVLAPSTWAGTAGDGTIRPDLRQIRRWVDANFGRVRSSDRDGD